MNTQNGLFSEKEMGPTYGEMTIERIRRRIKPEEKNVVLMKMIKICATDC
jgi:hypothetical protein